MKIWFPLIAAGTGSDVYTVRLANSLKTYGIDTEITFFPKYFEFIPSLLRKYQPPVGTDIVHANSWNAFAFKRPGIKLITTVHLPILDPSFRRHKSIAQMYYHRLHVKRIEKYSLRSANKIIAVSNYVKNSVADTYDAITAETIYNYVDTGYFCPTEKYVKEINRPFRLLFIGNLTRRKGADLLEPIMNKLGDNYFLTATSGLGDHKFALNGENILNVGRLEGMDLVNAYRQADALLFPTRLEGFGYSALEAMACGIPVITSNNSSLPEIVQHQKTGILCTTDNVQDFVDACRTLRDNPSTLAAYSEAARDRAVSSFSEQMVIRKYINMYSNVLNNQAC